MKLITVFFVNGLVSSVTGQSVTVRLDAKPDCDPIVQVMPLASFPCDISEGDSFHLIKAEEGSDVIVACGVFNESR
jgi:hypothetical protein